MPLDVHILKTASGKWKNIYGFRRPTMLSGRMEVLIVVALVFAVVFITVGWQRIRLWPFKPGQLVQLKPGASPYPHGMLPGIALDFGRDYTVAGGEGAKTIRLKETGRTQYSAENFLPRPQSS